MKLIERVKDLFSHVHLQWFSASPVWHQVSFQFREDDNDEANATWIGSLNDDVSDLTNDQNYRLRINLEEQNSAAGKNETPFWALSYNSGNYVALNTLSSYVMAVASGQAGFNNADDTTQQLTAAGFDTTNECCTEDGVAGGTVCDPPQAGNIETELCFQIIAADVNNGDTIDIQLRNLNLATEYGQYDQTPRITVLKAAAVVVVTAETVIGSISTKAGALTKKGYAEATPAAVGAVTADLYKYPLQVAATIAEAFSLAAVGSISNPLDTTIPAAGTVTAALSKKGYAQAAIDAASTFAGALSQTNYSNIAAAAASTFAAALSYVGGVESVAATIPAVSTFAAAAQKTGYAESTIPAVSTVAAALSYVGGVEAVATTIAAQSTVTSAVELKYSAAASIAAVSTVTFELRKQVIQLTATIAETFTLAAVGSVNVNIETTIPAVSTFAGNLLATYSPPVTIPAVSTFIGETFITRLAEAAIPGQTTTAFNLSTVTGVEQLTATIPGQSAFLAAAIVKRFIDSSIAAQSTFIADATVTAQGQTHQVETTIPATTTFAGVLSQTNFVETAISAQTTTAFDLQIAGGAITVNVSIDSQSATTNALNARYAAASGISSQGNFAAAAKVKKYIAAAIDAASAFEGALSTIVELIQCEVAIDSLTTVAANLKNKYGLEIDIATTTTFSSVLQQLHSILLSIDGLGDFSPDASVTKAIDAFFETERVRTTVQMHTGISQTAQMK